MPFANKLILFFQKVWEESSGECLLQIQLLVALRNFVVALGYQSPICYDILLPILQKGIDIDSPDELNLLEDSMLLWEATLSHAPSMVPQLLAYFPCVVKIMERSFDHLQVRDFDPAGPVCSAYFLVLLFWNLSDIVCYFII
ncbi:hypothetical protein L3X38_000424 [Prunus dulcis]|uniref:Importin-7/11-like TPR repeats domain-containing protein n=1 Tax=Prunus dulcis TaxID=3755 RepID=A0AAD4WSN1_PRUDU|nr:hypothetical protein L3X38_000424 [Prunus dulcis]